MWSHAEQLASWRRVQQHSKSGSLTWSCWRHHCKELPWRLPLPSAQQPNALFQKFDTSHTHYPMQRFLQIRVAAFFLNMLFMRVCAMVPNLDFTYQTKFSTTVSCHKGSIWIASKSSEVVTHSVKYTPQILLLLWFAEILTN